MASPSESLCIVTKIGNLTDSRKAKEDIEKKISQTLRLKLNNSDTTPFLPLTISHITYEYVGRPENRLKHRTIICSDEDVCVVMLL